MNRHNPTKQTILVFSVLIFILFFIITVLSAVQYSRYKITDGTAICEEFLNRCLLSFHYLDAHGDVKTKVSPIAYHEINQSGVFSVKVAYAKPSNDHEDPTDFFVVGSPYHVFLGTKSMLVIYIILTFLAFLICLSFMPGLYSSTKKN